MMAPKQAFLFGIVGGILVLCTIGFFILLLGGGDMSVKKTPTREAAQQAAAPTPSAQPTPATSVPEPTSDDHIRGNASAEVFIVEYSDIECPFCTRFHDTMKDVIDQYGDQVGWVYRHLPLEGLHPNARLAANATECVADQGGDFWSYLDELFERQTTGINRSSLIATARDLGINTTRLEDCIDSGTFNDLVTEQAGHAVGRGTPFSVIIGPNGEQVPLVGAQPFATVEAALLQFLN